MYKNVIIKAFEQAKNEIPGKSNKTSISDHISSILLNNYRYQISGKTLRNLYDESKECKEEIDISINSNHVVHLCKYLGYDNYNQFLEDTKINVNVEAEKGVLIAIKKHKVLLILSAITIIVIYSITTFNKQRWMVWEENQYVEVKLDVEKYKMNEIKLYNDERIKHFKKISVDCETIFFDSEGNVKIWYGKNNTKELEYFTSLGLHPETSKTLKPITKYMIKTHICDGYNN